MRALLAPGCYRKHDPHGRAAFRRTLDLNLRVMRLGNCAHDREAEPQPAFMAVRDVPEPIEQVLKALRRNPGTCVMHTELDAFVGLRDSDANRPTLRRGLECVAKEVGEQLYQAVWVAPHYRQAGRGGPLERDLVVVCGGLE